MTTRPTAEERIDRCQTALEILDSDPQHATKDQAMAVIQIGATLAVAEALLEIRDVIYGLGERKQL